MDLLNNEPGALTRIFQSRQIGQARQPNFDFPMVVFEENRGKEQFVEQVGGHLLGDRVRSGEVEQQNVVEVRILTPGYRSVTWYGYIE